MVLVQDIDDVNGHGQQKDPDFITGNHVVSVGVEDGEDDVALVASNLRDFLLSDNAVAVGVCKEHQRLDKQGQQFEIAAVVFSFSPCVGLGEVGVVLAIKHAIAVVVEHGEDVRRHVLLQFLILKQAVAVCIHIGQRVANKGQQEINPIAGKRQEQQCKGFRANHVAQVGGNAVNFRQDDIAVAI